MVDFCVSPWHAPQNELTGRRPRALKQLMARDSSISVITKDVSINPNVMISGQDGRRLEGEREEGEAFRDYTAGGGVTVADRSRQISANRDASDPPKTRRPNPIISTATRRDGGQFFRGVRVVVVGGPGWLVFIYQRGRCSWVDFISCEEAAVNSTSAVSLRLHYCQANLADQPEE